MTRHSATLTTKGQVTLPIRLRDALGLKPGDEITFVEDPNGDFLLQAHSHSLADLRGSVRPSRRIRAAELDQWIEEARGARPGRRTK